MVKQLNNMHCNWPETSSQALDDIAAIVDN